MAQKDIPSKIERAYGVYRWPVLLVYDCVVYHIFNPWIWHMPTGKLIQWYKRYLADTHLEVGVGTGFLLDKSLFPSQNLQLTLLDANALCLKKTAQRLKRYQPTQHLQSILEPSSLQGTFQSIGMSYLLHCLPGTLEEKGVVFKHIKQHLAPGGIVFGSTLLSQTIHQTSCARFWMRCYNLLGVFNNEKDTLDAFNHLLRQHFNHYQLHVIGNGVLFAASDAPLPAFEEPTSCLY